MKADLPRTVHKIAQFMGIELDDELFDIVVRQSSREYMLKHSHQFDEQHMREIGGKRASLPPAIDSSKVTSGNSNHARYQLSSESKQILDDIWCEQITAKYGFETYNDLRQAVRDLDNG